MKWSITMKYLSILLTVACMNVYANEIEAELGEHPYVNTNTMKAARYFCHAFFVLAAEHPDAQKVEHLPHKVATLSSHCAKGNFHQALTDSGLAKVVNLHNYFALNERKVIGGPGSVRQVNLGTRKVNIWEHRAIATTTLMHPEILNNVRGIK